MLALVLALGASLSWGSADYLGGLTTRRASLWTVVAGGQLVSLSAIGLVVAVSGHPWPGLHAIWPVLLGGMAGAVAIATFYKALAIGTMSIVAPISAMCAVIPFLVGLASGERPDTLQYAGVALAALGVVLAASERSRAGETIGAGALPGEPAVEPHAEAASDGTPGGGTSTPRRLQQRRAVLLSLVAALGIGLMLLGFDATAKYDALWATLGSRFSSACCIAVFLLVLRPRLGTTRAAVPAIIAAGVLDTTANLLFSFATTQGYLSIVAVLGSVYPVVTVILAYVLLRERIARHQTVGVLATLVGVALIAAG
jgi:drug/metabolite transporter (DMT)-like permease